MTIPGDQVQIGDGAGLVGPTANGYRDRPDSVEARGLAHDLAHLLNVVGNLAHLLMIQADDPEAVRRHAGRLAQLAERSAGLPDRVGGRGRASGPAAGGPRRLARRDATEAQAPLHVLVVEDELAGRDLLGALLSGAGHRVTVAGGVREALRVLDSPVGTLDVLLTDVGLDDGSGWELVGLARQRLPGLRIGVVTGWSGPPVNARSADADFIVGKPFRLDELLSHLEVRG